ncbi:sigma factor-like helix-turn-helix DNA-binding protein [Nocardioides houyundeii]|uniref:sigma factor-like helix-turn-helix DNA-binding protein n=1 Tax=Nocardioides houyundeii TaxID=2045452 RepID=UPI0013B44859|nr:sigma factor-like helix-turn-helix DNA-binding protein [Nocardioides houyundeii]
MTEHFIFDFDDIRPRTWADAFPWLSGAAGAAGAVWRDQAVDDTDIRSRQAFLAQISELAMERLTHWTIGQIFPGLSSEVDLLEGDLPARAYNALIRSGYRTSGQLMGVALEDMLGWRQVGVGTVDAILQRLADVSTSLATPPITQHDYTPPTGPSSSSDAVRMPEWLLGVVDDLNTLASWYAAIGLTGQRLVGDPIAPGTPPDVVKARQRLEALSPTHVLTSSELQLDIADLFDDALGMLDQRASNVLGRRLFADEPLTLDQLGEMHDVTRERIRQIEGKARGVMLSFVSEDGPVAAVAHAARDLIGTVRPLDDLIELIPALGATVERVGQPAWRVLDRLDDAYEIENGWCVVPTMSEARLLTQQLLEEHSDPYGVVRIDDINVVESAHPERLPELTSGWLSHCGYIVDNNVVLTRTSSVGDYAAAVLSIAGSPLSLQEIVDRFVFDRTTGSTRNAMGIDDRFERVDRDRWALTEWGLEAYSGIRSIIREQVARNGGRIKLSELVEYVTARYSVSGSSVIAYAGAIPFATRNGVVQLATEDQGASKAPQRTRRLFRRADGWAYRVRITTDHLRGSGSVAPHAIATILDLRAGDTQQLNSPLGPQSVAWTGLQPQFGTIRRFLMAEDVAAGAEAFLVLHDDGAFTFELTRNLIDNPLADALSLAGAPAVADREEARTALARAIRLPDASPVTSIIGGYRERGDDDIAELLITVREYLETGYEPSEIKHSADVDAILDLL